jgi:hypothetical protein
MISLLAGICIGVILTAALAVSVSGLLIHSLSGRDPNETIVINGEVYDAELIERK